MGFQLQGNLSQVATVLTIYGIETDYDKLDERFHIVEGCNSTYRLRY